MRSGYPYKAFQSNITWKYRKSTLFTQIKDRWIKMLEINECLLPLICITEDITGLKFYAQINEVNFSCLMGMNKEQ